ncbi:MAG: ATP-binding cassette domain-containing protein, partial [Sphingomonadaceae bacterium]
MMQPAPHIHTTDLACRRGDRLLVCGLSLSRGQGDALHIAGANGIGKTSLIRIIAGLLRPLSGTATSSGTMGMVDRNHALDPQLPLDAALRFWSQM